MNNDIFTPDLPIPEPVEFEDAPIPAPVEEEKPAETPPSRRRRKADAPVLTIESGDEIETADAREAAAWHEIHNAYRTRRILSAPLGGIEQTDSGKTIAVVDYNGFRIVIPLKEMMVMPNAANSIDSMTVRQMKLLGNMLGAEIDFVILGIDSKNRSVVASRREAMMRKRQLFYFSPDANGEYRVREGRVVQARVIAVADKSIRVEIFGVECSIMARDLAWDWIGDAHDRFAVGDQILVRVTEVSKTSQEELSVHADVKSVTENTSRKALKRCRVQSKYAGRVTDVHKGIVYVRLSNGVNAVAHSCYDRRTPGKKDDVSFVVTKLDEERSITIGETLQADSTYMATAHYAGTVTRTEAGTVHYTLLYAPVSVPAVVAAAESGITPALLIMGIACALLFIAVLLIITHLLHKEPVHATEPAKSAPAPKVYVPSGDIVLGGRNEDDDEENL